METSLEGHTNLKLLADLEAAALNKTSRMRYSSAGAGGFYLMGLLSLDYRTTVTTDCVLMP